MSSLGRKRIFPKVYIELLLEDGGKIVIFGDTYGYMSKFKQWGFKWDRKKRQWYKNTLEQVKPFDQIDMLYNDIVLDFKEKIKQTLRKIMENGSLIEPKGIKLRPYQREGALLALHNRSFLLAYEMGLGKTFTALSAGITEKAYRNKRGQMGNILYIAPASLRYNVYLEAVKGGMSAAIYPKAHRQYSYTNDPFHSDYDVLIMSYRGATTFVQKNTDRIPELFKDGKYSAIIIDEAHMIKNYKAQRTKAIIKMGSEARKYDAMVLFLTGTPILNRPSELYTIFKFLFPSVESWSLFVKRYNSAYRDNFGLKMGKPNNLEELHERLRSKMHRKTKEEVLKDLPPLIRVITKITDIKKPSRELLEGNVGQLSKYKHELAMSKIDVTVGLAMEAIPFLIFTEYRTVAEELARKLLKNNIKIGLIHGGVNQSFRMKQVQSFQKGELDGMVLVIKAGGQGLNLQRAKTVIFNDVPWGPGWLTQAESRAHRIGTKDSITSILMIAEGDPLEEILIKYISQKLDTIKKVTDGMFDREIKLTEEEYQYSQSDFFDFFKKQYRPKDKDKDKEKEKLKTTENNNSNDNDA